MSAPAPDSPALSPAISPAISLVVVSFNAPELLERCLQSIAKQLDRNDNKALRRNEKNGIATPKQLIEILIVRSDPSDDLGRMSRELAEVHVLFPKFHWVEAPFGATVPQMRALGSELSSGKILALVEDDCLLSKDWCSGILLAHAEGHQAVGGAVQPNKFDHCLDWAVFFCEYARFMPPFSGVVPYLSGNNLSYKRETIEKLRQSGALKDGLYEVFVNSTLQQQGHELYAAPDVCVTNINQWHVENATRIPFHHGRGFAAMRFPKEAITQRLLYCGVAFLLPGLQSVRICASVLSRKRHTGALIAALPFIVLFWTSWSVGEFMGYLLGPGNSLEHWR